MMLLNALRVLTIAGCAISCYAASETAAGIPVVYMAEHRFLTNAKGKFILDKDGNKQKDRLKKYVWIAEEYNPDSMTHKKRAEQREKCGGLFLSGTYKLSKIDDNFRKTYESILKEKLLRESFRKEKYQGHESHYDLPKVGDDKREYVPKNHVVPVDNRAAHELAKALFKECDKEVELIIKKEAAAAAAEEKQQEKELPKTPELDTPVENPVKYRTPQPYAKTFKAKPQKIENPKPMMYLTNYPHWPKRAGASSPPVKSINRRASQPKKEQKEEAEDKGETLGMLPTKKDINRLLKKQGLTGWTLDMSLMNSNLHWRNCVSNHDNNSEKKYYLYRIRGKGEKVVLLTVTTNEKDNYMLRFTGQRPQDDIRFHKLNLKEGCYVRPYKKDGTLHNKDMEVKSINNDGSIILNNKKRSKVPEGGFIRVKKGLRTTQRNARRELASPYEIRTVTKYRFEENSITLGFADKKAVNLKLPFTLPEDKPCSHCNGTGTKTRGSSESDCKSCGATGVSNYNKNTIASLKEHFDDFHRGLLQEMEKKADKDQKSSR